MMPIYVKMATGQRDYEVPGSVWSAVAYCNNPTRYHQAMRRMYRHFGGPQ